MLQCAPRVSATPPNLFHKAQLLSSHLVSPTFKKGHGAFEDLTLFSKFSTRKFTSFTSSLTFHQFEMFSSIKFAALVAIAFAAGQALAENHTVSFTNNCGYGTPMLIGQGGVVLSTGEAYTSNGRLLAAIAYLQTGSCGFNGENCTLVETTLVNPTSPGSGSSSDLSLIPPHAFSVAAGFEYLGGCAGAGVDCNNANCNTAFHNPDDNGVIVTCQNDNVNLGITFCS
ncbi:Glycopeptide [Mycena sanguinolenta]|uniref:Glycopeptide n=1 Tax=Mycena sanguinolenta TaxID=230812 RepID=A0A8H6Y3B3_9AGAR|nr:Glycopeptide [Mycena sanguinolenta]